MGNFFSPPTFLQYGEADISFTLSKIYTISESGYITFNYLHPYSNIKETSKILEWMLVLKKENFSSILHSLESYVSVIEYFSDEESYSITFNNEFIYPSGIKNLFFILKKMLILIKTKISTRDERVDTIVISISSILNSYDKEKHVFFSTKMSEERERNHVIAMNVLNSLDV